MYEQFLGFGLSPNPKRSTANNLQLCFTSLDRLGNTVSVQNAEEERKPCINIAFSVESLAKSSVKEQVAAIILLTFLHTADFCNVDCLRKSFNWENYMEQTMQQEDFNDKRRTLSPKRSQFYRAGVSNELS